MLVRMAAIRSGTVAYDSMADKSMAESHMTTETGMTISAVAVSTVITVSTVAAQRQHRCGRNAQQGHSNDENLYVSCVRVVAL